MKYSIIIPVFNKAAFTKRCLDTLRPTLDGAGEGEVIVVDNASSDETPELLANYPWIRLIRNERNLGFAGANNQAAREARGEYLVLLNNDTEAFPGWLAAMLDVMEKHADVGIVGARLLFPDKTVQHAGVVVAGATLGRFSMSPFHHNYMVPWNDADVSTPAEFQIVTGACLATRRDVYLELGGLDERYWNGYEDVDYCLKVRDRGLRVMYEPAATLFHFESQSGVQRFRKNHWNVELLEERWRGATTFDAVQRNFSRGLTRRALRESRGGTNWFVGPAPEISVVVHGAVADKAAFERAIRSTKMPVHAIVWTNGDDAIDRSRELMELRGNRGIAFVSGAVTLSDGWLDELVAQVEGSPNCVASTGAPELGHGENVTTLAADARCTLVMLYDIPQHVRLNHFETLDGAVADLLLRMVDLGYGTRGVRRSIVASEPVTGDASFFAVHGLQLREVLTSDLAAVEQRLRRRQPAKRGLVSIVTLSWNAVTYTKMALDSIRRFTSEPYEVIVVDNGSQSEAVDYLKSVDDPHVRVIYNSENLGYAGGNNIGMSAAAGDYVVILNNDVIVTEGWLDGLLAPFDRIPTIGVTAPRSNKVVGHQVVGDAVYNGMDEIQSYARDRQATWDANGYTCERAIGLCLCVDRRVISEVGGFDERFGLGNFEDDDLCVRIRAAGYKIYVCDDVFIHHFGSQSFAANKVDYAATMTTNWKKFAAKWGYDGVDPKNGYDPRLASNRGFRRADHYAPLPAVAPDPSSVAPVASTSDARAQVVFAAVVESEEDWQTTAEFAKRFARAFTCEDPVRLSIATLSDSVVAETIGSRLTRLLERLEIPDARAPEIDVTDEEDAASWRGSLDGEAILDVRSMTSRSPSALRRLLSAEVSA